MKLIIEHRKTKREINGAFAICLGINELQQLKSIIDSAIEKEHVYGWLYVDEAVQQPAESDYDIIKRQKLIANTGPISWD